jgi:hypothetical protein
MWNYDLDGTVFLLRDLEGQIVKTGYHKGGSSGGSSTQTVQNYSPEEAANRAKVQKEGERIYDAVSGNVSASPYPGAQPVGLPGDSYTGQNLTKAGANTVANQYLPALGQATQFGLSNVLDPNSNQYLKSTIDATIRPITESYTDAGGVMSQIRNNAIANGGQGNSTRQGVAEGIAAGRYANAIGDAASKVTTDAYGKGLDTFSKIYGLAPNAASLTTMPGQAYSAVGSQNQNQAQLQENYAADSRNWQLNKDWLPLQNWANIVYGSGPTGSTTESKTNGGGSGSNTAMGALGGALSGYQAFGPWGALGGAVLGGLFS